MDALTMVLALFAVFLVAFLAGEWHELREETSALAREIKESLETRILRAVVVTVLMGIVVLLFGKNLPFDVMDAIMGAVIASICYPLAHLIEKRWFD